MGIHFDFREFDLKVNDVRASQYTRHCNRIVSATPVICHVIIATCSSPSFKVKNP